MLIGNKLPPGSQVPCTKRVPRTSHQPVNLASIVRIFQTKKLRISLTPGLDLRATKQIVNLVLGVQQIDECRDLLVQCCKNVELQWSGVELGILNCL